jgi:hypothetical protein
MPGQRMTMGHHLDVISAVGSARVTHVGADQPPLDSIGMFKPTSDLAI